MVQNRLALIDIFAPCPVHFVDLHLLLFEHFLYEICGEKRENYGLKYQTEQNAPVEAYYEL